MSSSKGLRRHNFFDLPDDDRKRIEFRAAFPQEATLILDTFEKLISRCEEDAIWVARTREGDNVFLIKESLRSGKSVFEVTIVFKLFRTEATWINFDWSHSTIETPYAPTPIQVLEEVLDSLRKKADQRNP